MKYQERLKQKKYYVVLDEKTVLGVFTNLRKACDFMKGKKFPSYWTLARKELGKVQRFGEYSLQIVKHQ